MIEEAILRAQERARRLNVDPQLTVTEVYAAELLRRLQQKLRGNLVWKGGAVLRLEGSERFSRDLDATLSAGSRVSLARLIRTLEDAGQGLPFLSSTQVDRTRAQSVRALYRFSVPELLQPLRVEVEISRRERLLRRPAVISTARMAHPAGLEPVLIACLEGAELLAEKVRALVVRRAARDIYDVYWLLQQGVEFDPALFRRKMRYYREAAAGEEKVEKTLARALRDLEGRAATRLRTELANLFPAERRGLDFAVILEDVTRSLRQWLRQLAPRKSPAVGRRGRKKHH